MRQTNYRDLPGFGLRLVGPDDPGFDALVRDIESRPQPFDSWPTRDVTNTAVLLNESGKAIVVLAYLWRYTSAGGATRTRRTSNLGLGSSMQLEVLSGRMGVVRDLGSFILPGSKRLITERGMFGNNLDVLPRDESRHRGGYMGAGGGESFGERDDQIVGIELSLDLAILEDGLCVGPDESGLFDSLTAALELQHRTAQEAVMELRSGASEGRVFDILLPLARQTHGGSPGGRPHPSVLAPMFANMAIHQLLNPSASERLAWFETIAQPPSLRLRRA